MPQSERRKHSRLELKAYGFSHVCRLRTMFGVVNVHLIDISPGGARIRFMETNAVQLTVAASVELDTLISARDTALDGIHGQIRWMHGEECGLMFERELELAATDLQDLLTP